MTNLKMYHLGLVELIDADVKTIDQKEASKLLLFSDGLLCYLGKNLHHIIINSIK